MLHIPYVIFQLINALISLPQELQSHVIASLLLLLDDIHLVNAASEPMHRARQCNQPLVSLDSKSPKHAWMDTISRVDAERSHTSHRRSEVLCRKQKSFQGTSAFASLYKFPHYIHQLQAQIMHCDMRNTT